MRIKLSDIDFDRHQIRINQGKGKKDRIVPHPKQFQELLALHADKMKNKGAEHLFESYRKKAYSDRAIRKILA